MVGSDIENALAKRASKTSCFDSRAVCPFAFDLPLTAFCNSAINLEEKWRTIWDTFPLFLPINRGVPPKGKGLSFIKVGMVAGGYLSNNDGSTGFKGGMS